MFSQVLERIALALDQHGIPYMLIGGQAVLLHGEPRLTQDVDITLGISPQRLDDLLAIVTQLSWQVLVEDAPAFVKKTLVLPTRVPKVGIRVDFIFSFSPYECQAIERSKKVAIGKAKVAFAAVEDLIIHKVVAGRPRDLEDVRIMLAKNPDVDMAYIRKWLAQFEESLGEPLLRRFKELS